MRFASVAFSLTAILSAFVAAAPVSSNEVAKRMPTPDEFDALPAEQKRKVYTAWYRATNILPATDE